MLAAIKNIKTKATVVETEAEKILRKEERRKQRKKDKLRAKEEPTSPNIRKSWRQILALPNISQFFKKNDPVSAMLEVVSDREGIVAAELNRLHTTKAEKRLWITLWIELVGENSYKMTYSKFISYFNIIDNTWIRRLFDIMNHTLTGVATFLEFLKFCTRFLLVDLQTTEELSFRLISRRGATFNEGWSVLDIEDLKHFLGERYTLKGLAQKKRRALAVLVYIDTNSDGGLSISEFHDFCKINSVFVKFTHKIQQHLRKCVLGLGYWVPKSRRIKMDEATGLNALSLISRINIESELYTVVKLTDPVVDGRGRPLESVGGGHYPSSGGPSLPTLPLPPSSTSSSLQALSMPSSSHLTQGSSPASPDGGAFSSTSGSHKKQVKAEESVVPPPPPPPPAKRKTMLCWGAVLDLAAVARGNFQDDFAEVVEERDKRLMQKQNKARETLMLADTVAGLSLAGAGAAHKPKSPKHASAAGALAGDTDDNEAGEAADVVRDLSIAGVKKSVGLSVQIDIHASILAACQQAEQDEEMESSDLYLHHYHLDLEREALHDNRTRLLNDNKIRMLAWVQERDNIVP